MPPAPDQLPSEWIAQKYEDWLNATSPEAAAINAIFSIAYILDQQAKKIKELEDALDTALEDKRKMVNKNFRRFQ